MANYWIFATNLLHSIIADANFKIRKNKNNIALRSVYVHFKPLEAEGIMSTLSSPYTKRLFRTFAVRQLERVQETKFQAIGIKWDYPHDTFTLTIEILPWLYYRFSKNNYCLWPEERYNCVFHNSQNCQCYPSKIYKVNVPSPYRPFSNNPSHVYSPIHPLKTRSAQRTAAIPRQRYPFIPFHRTNEQIQFKHTNTKSSEISNWRDPVPTPNNIESVIYEDTNNVVSVPRTEVIVSNQANWQTTLSNGLLNTCQFANACCQYGLRFRVKLALLLIILQISIIIYMLNNALISLIP
jgi:hypothetical protein